MRQAVFGALLALSSGTLGCYSPRTQEGLGCTSTGGCPDGQSCIDGVCYRPGNSAPADAAVDANNVQCTTEVVATGQTGATDLDARDSEYVYWTDEETNLVVRSPKLRGPVEVFHDSGADKHPHAIATDDIYVYWSESDPAGRIVRKLKESAELDPVEELASGQGEPVAIAVDTTHVYWANFGGNSIARVSKEGGPVELLATSQLQPTALAIDADSGFWVASGSDTIVSAPKNGDARQLLASSTGTLSRLAIVDERVYWTDAELGNILSVAKAGGAEQRFVQGQDAPGAVAASSSGLYWANTETDEVVVQGLMSNSSHVVASEQSGTAAIEVSGDHVYWLNADDADNRLVRASCSSL